MDIEAELKSWEVPTQLEALACDRRIEALKDEKAALPRQHIGKAAEEFIRMRGLELDAEIDRETGDASSWRCRSEFFGKRRLSHGSVRDARFAIHGEDAKPLQPSPQGRPRLQQH
jgi:hypothetical protein